MVDPEKFAEAPPSLQTRVPLGVSLYRQYCRQSFRTLCCFSCLSWVHYSQSFLVYGCRYIVLSSVFKEFICLSIKDGDGMTQSSISPKLGNGCTPLRFIKKSFCLLEQNLFPLFFCFFGLQIYRSPQ